MVLNGKKAIAACTLSFFLLSCGGGGGSGGDGTAQPLPNPTPTPTPTPEPSPTPVPEGDYVNGQVLLLWDAPTSRESGDPMFPEDLGGYELRYKRHDQTEFTYLITPTEDGSYHRFEYLEGYYQFQVAAYDINGLYSRFMPLTPQ